MTVAQIHAMYAITARFSLKWEKKVNFTQWTHGKHITLSFMNNEGEVWRYDIRTDGTYEGTMT